MKTNNLLCHANLNLKLSLFQAGQPGNSLPQHRCFLFQFADTLPQLGGYFLAVLQRPLQFTITMPILPPND
jgi:hypothetical protein